MNLFGKDERPKYLTDEQKDELAVKIGKKICEWCNKKTSLEQWFDIEETCQLLKVSKRTMQDYRDKGLITFSQIGGKIYVSASAIEEHLRNHAHKAFKKIEKSI